MSFKLVILNNNMKFHDLHVHSVFSFGESNLEQLAKTFKELGYSSFCYSFYYENLDQIKKIRELIEKIRNKVSIKIYLGLEARNEKEIEKIKLIRKKIDVFLVSGGNLSVNRKAVETPEVDILTHPENNRNDPGLNDVLLKFAAKNNVAIEINFREILNSSKKNRAKILSNMFHNIRIAKKFKTPIIVSSGALSHFEIKDPLVLTSLINFLGLEIDKAKETLSKIPENILKESKKRISDKWIIPGVEIK